MTCLKNKYHVLIYNRLIKQNMYITVYSKTYALTKVSKLMRGLSELINLSCRLAVGRLGRTKLIIGQWSQQNSMICVLLVLKSFMRNRFATKSREFN